MAKKARANIANMRKLTRDVKKLNGRIHSKRAAASALSQKPRKSR